MGGPSSDQLAIAKAASNQQLSVSQQSQAQGAQSYAATEPGLQTAENYYQKLASGDPNEISSAVGPAVDQLKMSNAAQQQNLRMTMPRGGTEQLAEAQSDIATTGQIGNLKTSAFTGAAPALASLASSGMGLSVNEIANAISGASGAGSTATNVMGIQAQQKGATMGLLGGLAGAGGSMGSSAIGNKGGGGGGGFTPAPPIGIQI